MANHLCMLLFLSAFLTCWSKTCLCVFDVDRTLTGRQDAAEECHGNVLVKDANDFAYCGGSDNCGHDLVLSALAVNLNRTFCGGCYLGVVSAGVWMEKPGKARVALTSVLKGKSSYSATSWDKTCDSDGDISGPFVLSCPDGLKQNTVRSIVDWYKQVHNVNILDSEVYMFDDRVSNIESFRDSGFNAVQVSCASRDPDEDGSVKCPSQVHGGVGYCGATPDEIVPAQGVHLCPSVLPITAQEQQRLNSCKRYAESTSEASECFCSRYAPQDLNLSLRLSYFPSLSILPILAGSLGACALMWYVVRLTCLRIGGEVNGYMPLLPSDVHA